MGGYDESTCCTRQSTFPTNITFPRCDLQVTRKIPPRERGMIIREVRHSMSQQRDRYSAGAGAINWRSTGGSCPHRGREPLYFREEKIGFSAVEKPWLSRALGEKESENFYICQKNLGLEIHLSAIVIYWLSSLWGEETIFFIIITMIDLSERRFF